MSRASHMPFADFRRGVARALVRGHRVERGRAVKLVKKWHDVILSRWMAHQEVEHVAKHVFKYDSQGVVCPCERRARDCPKHGRYITLMTPCGPKRMKKPSNFGRDANNPRAGEVYESRWGNRWLVTGRTTKGRVLVKRTAPRYDGELQWTPAMLARLKQVRGQEAKAVAAAIPEDMKDKRFPSGASLVNRIGRFLGNVDKPDPTGPERFMNRDPNRRYYVYVIETLKGGKRQFYVGQTGKKPEQRFKEHKSGHHFSYAKGAKLLRKDLTKKVPTLYTRQQAERAEKIIARTLRKRGLSVTGGH
jgi:predicted GIY-YIG superfamily endonuclease